MRLFVARGRLGGRSYPVETAGDIEDFGALAALLNPAAPGIIVRGLVATTITFYDPSLEAGPRSRYLRADVRPRVVQTAGGATLESAGINVSAPEALLLRQTFGKLYWLVKIV